ESYTAPQTEAEAVLCVIWQEVLGLERVGVTDDFFRIGGNSILAIHLTHKIGRALGYTVKISDIFSYPRIRQFIENKEVNIVEYVEGEL
ncbi:phosphopantetheine-binding protein, partial [Mucilaginibacter calamicampi]